MSKIQELVFDKGEETFETHPDDYDPRQDMAEDARDADWRERKLDDRYPREAVELAGRGLK